MQAPSEFLASAAATFLLQDAILASSLIGVDDDTAVSIVKTSWCNLAKTIELPGTSNGRVMHCHNRTITKLCSITYFVEQNTSICP